MTKTKINLESREIKELSEQIANLLGETENKSAKFGIRAMIGVGGSQFALKCLVKAATMKRNGVTMKTDDGKRYRTLGGCFFKIAKDAMSSSKRYRYMSLVNPKQSKNGNKRDRRGDRNGR